MAGEGVWPKVNGDVLYASDINAVQRATSSHINLIGEPDLQGQGTWAMAAQANQLFATIVSNIATTADGDNMSYVVYLSPGTYDFQVTGRNDTNLGITDIKLNGVKVGSSIDWYGASAENVVESVSGGTIATAGTATVTVELNGKNASSSDYRADISLIRVTRSA